MANNNNNNANAIETARTTQIQETNYQTIFESLALKGDISGLSPVERVRYYEALCKRLDLDPMTQPFIPLTLNGKQILYASRSATDQIARNYSINRTIKSRDFNGDLYIVVVAAELPGGRIEESTGALSVKGLQGDALANALMKCETKAKRRATLALIGLGMLDETEIESIPASAKQAPKQLPPPVRPETEGDRIYRSIVEIAKQLNDLGDRVVLEVNGDEVQWSNLAIKSFACDQLGAFTFPTTDLPVEALNKLRSLFEERLDQVKEAAAIRDQDQDPAPAVETPIAEVPAAIDIPAQEPPAAPEATNPPLSVVPADPGASRPQDEAVPAAIYGAGIDPGPTPEEIAAKWAPRADAGYRSPSYDAEAGF